MQAHALIIDAFPSMPCFMFDWLENPHADYVLAAYGVAAAALIALGVVSWIAARCAKCRWRQLQDRDP